MITRAGKGSPIVYVNKAFTALTGYSAKNVIGKSPMLLQGAATEGAPRCTASLYGEGQGF